jgi:chemotaxis protein MotB
MKPLIEAGQVTVKRENHWLKIEITTDILFPSGAGGFASAAQPVLDKLAEVLKPFPNPIRVEGHTDDRPIRTAAFPSNWELAAARSASVVHQFMGDGIDPLRLEIVGYGEYRPKQPNDTLEGRNANRRVSVLVNEELEPSSGSGPPDATTADAHGTADADGVAAAAPASEVDPTVLAKNQGKAMQAPAQHSGPVELIRPGSGPSEAKAPPPKHE